jgi:L-asparaginase II
VNAPLRVEVERSGVVESVHEADCVVVDLTGSVIASAGDTSRVAYLRSAAKPLQAAVCLANGWNPSDDRHVAVACGSHSGEPEHLEAVRGILEAAGLDESALRCPAAKPFAPDSPAAPSRVAHNCSGKHAAMLATAQSHGWPLATYPSRDHPLQRAVAERVETLASASPVTGVDGCGVPTFAFPLDRIARAFAGLASADAELTRAAEAMRAHPFYVAGRNRVCTELMRSLPGALAKVGAEGLGCVLYDRRVICFKVRDGSARAREMLMAAVVEISGLAAPLPAALARYASPPVRGGETAAGQARVRGSLG